MPAFLHGLQAGQGRLLVAFCCALHFFAAALNVLAKTLHGVASGQSKRKSNDTEDRDDFFHDIVLSGLTSKTKLSTSRLHLVPGGLINHAGGYRKVTRCKMSATSVKSLVIAAMFEELRSVKFLAAFPSCAATRAIPFPPAAMPAVAALTVVNGQA
jgi:hypothetical protein